MGVVRELITKWSFLADTKALVATEKLFESLLQKSDKLGKKLGLLKIELNFFYPYSCSTPRNFKHFRQ